MKHLLILTLLFLIFTSAYSQNTFRSIIQNTSSEILPGASVTWKEGNHLSVADNAGSVTIRNIPNGNQTFSITHLGHETKELKLIFPLTSDSTMIIILEVEEEHEEEVIISITRTSGTIANAPTRVEVISGEEMDEKGNMVPGDIRMVLNESTGIQTQQTSATSYNSSIRIQGLDGRYTQILRDGYPLYAGFSGGLSIMQIAPLDLRQVEVVKGSSSTLYGGGAIAGLVNLVSKTPAFERDLSFMGNVTSAGSLDLSGFYSKRNDHNGVSLFIARNSGSAYDPADIGLTAIPKFERYTINPRLFLYGKKTNFDIGGSIVTEDRTGGSMDYIKNGTAGYFEKNNTDRFSTQMGINHSFNDHSSLIFKNSFSWFRRKIEIPSHHFSGKQLSSFSELTWNNKKERSQWVAGLNLITDDFKEEPNGFDELRDYHITTTGAFVQNTWSPVNFITIETGIRSDYVKLYGWEFLPRISALFRFSPEFTSRIGGGLGYKTPTVFNEEAERFHFRNIIPININTAKNERSVGTNLDLNYKTEIGKLHLNINQLFFYTRLNKPLVLMPSFGGRMAFVNANGHIDSKGMETNLRLSLESVKFYFGYTYLDVNTHFNGIKNQFTLTSKHRLNHTLVYEKEKFLKAGLEAYYNSPQLLSDGKMGKGYWTFGFMTEKIWKKFSVFINFENFTDTRQTKFDTIFTGSVNNPVFRDIYAPLDGFVANGGFKLRL